MCRARSALYLSLALAGLALFAGLLWPAPASAGQIIRCQSHDYQYEYCPTGGRSRVRLSRQLSRSACIEGRTWGYDRRGVWVDHGCDAEFRILPRHTRRGPALFRCRSEQYSYQYCPTDTRGGVRLLKQRSKAVCVEGQSWGYDRRGVWVNHGCDAEFRTLPRHTRRRGPAAEPRIPRHIRRRGPSIFRCRSEHYTYQYCPTDTRGGVRLLKQRSKAVCVEGQSWGYDRRGVWVNHGCDAEFQTGGSVSRRP